MLTKKWTSFKTSNTEGFVYNSCNGTTVRACRLSPQKPQRSRTEWLPTAPNSHFVLFPITATIKSFVFSVLNSFLGDTYKKREWNRDSRRKCESSCSSFWTFFWVILIKRVDKRKKIRPTEMLVLFCGYDNRALQCAYSGYEENSALRKSSIKAKRSLTIERRTSDSVCSKA